MPFGRRLAALAVDLAGYVLATIFAGFVLTARDAALPAWRLALRALLLGAFVLPLLAALFLAVLIVLDEPWPGDLFGLAHDPGARGRRGAAAQPGGGGRRAAAGTGPGPHAGNRLRRALRPVPRR